MTQEAGRVAANISCLETWTMPFTRVSTAEFHSDVWRSIGVIVRGGERAAMDFVLKRYKRRCTLADVHVLGKEYCIFKGALEKSCRRPRFVATDVGSRPSVIFVAQNCSPWFDLSNPGNEKEALPLLGRRAGARAQLGEFARRARRWMDKDSRIIFRIETCIQRLEYLECLARRLE